MKSPFFFFFLYLAILPAFSQKEEKKYREAFALIEVWLDAQKDFDQLPGLSAIVVEDQQVLWTGAVGLANVEEGVKATPSTLCSICSISKLFTSIAIMKLYEEGKLRLDDHIDELLPTYTLRQQYKASGPITLRTLLTHSSGLPREASFPYWTGPDFLFPTSQEIDTKLSEQQTLYPASTYFQYSNLGLTLLGNIVEKVSGVSFDEYVQQNILKPLGLSNTLSELPEELYGSQLAVGYSALTRKGSREKVNFFQAKGMTPAAGFSSNVLDLGKFASWQLRLREATTMEVLKPATLKYMQRVHWTNPDWKTTWGLGFVVFKGSNGNTWVGHGGSCPGYRSSLQIDLNRKRAFSVMINASGTNPAKYINGMDSILEKMSSSKKGGTTNQNPDLNEYVGYYHSMPWWSEKYISTWNNQLVLLPLPSEQPGTSMTFYRHTQGDVFHRVRDEGTLGEALVFERDKTGAVIRYKTHGNYSNKIKKESGYE